MIFKYNKQHRLVLIQHKLILNLKFFHKFCEKMPTKHFSMFSADKSTFSLGLKLESMKLLMTLHNETKRHCKNDVNGALKQSKVGENADDAYTATYSIQNCLIFSFHTTMKLFLMNLVELLAI